MFTPIGQLNAGMSLARLEAEKQARDDEIANLRDEMGLLHMWLEPKWMAAELAKSTAASRAKAQTIATGAPEVKLGK